MKVVYQKRFLKDLAAVPSNLRPAIEQFVFEELPLADSLLEKVLAAITMLGKPRAQPKPKASL